MPLVADFTYGSMLQHLKLDSPRQDFEISCPKWGVHRLSGRYRNRVSQKVSVDISIKLRPTIVFVSPATSTDYQSTVGRETDRLSIAGCVSAVYR